MAGFLNLWQTDPVTLPLWNPLVDAASEGDISSVGALLKAGTPIDSRDFLGRTALIAASAIGNDKLVDVLLRKQANVNTVANRGTTALMMASSGGHHAVVRLLLNN